MSGCLITGDILMNIEFQMQANSVMMLHRILSVLTLIKEQRPLYIRNKVWSLSIDITPTTIYKATSC